MVFFFSLILVSPKQLDALFALIAEEELRRRQSFASKQLSEVELHTQMLTLLNFNALEAQFVTPHCELFKVRYVYVLGRVCVCVYMCVCGCCVCVCVSSLRGALNTCVRVHALSSHC